MRTATEMSMRVNLRRRRSEALVNAVLASIRPNLGHGADERSIYEALMELFTDRGVEMLTDHDRQLLSLPPRGPDGWTAFEIAALERFRLEMLTRPVMVPFTQMMAEGPSKKG